MIGLHLADHCPFSKRLLSWVWPSLSVLCPVFPHTVDAASELWNLFLYPSVSVWNLPDCCLACWLAESPHNPSLAMMSFAMSIGCKVLKRGLLTLVTSRSLSQQRLGAGGGAKCDPSVTTKLFSRPRLSDTFHASLRYFCMSHWPSN